MLEAPLPDSYRVAPWRLYAGEYAGARSPEEARGKLPRLLDAGIRVFVDLTEEGELEPYAHLLPAAPATRHLRLPIADGGCPTREAMARTLEAIDRELDAGAGVYLHCWGGHGRTGTVVGCFLVRHGVTGEEALERIEALRRALPDAAMPSPETDAQRRFVLAWAGAEPR